VSWDGALELGTCLGSKDGVSELGRVSGESLGQQGSLVGDNVLDLGTCLGLGDGILGQGMGSGTWE